jgi:hypothetical protein
VKWTRPIIIGVVALLGLFVIVGNLFESSDSGGSKTEVEQLSPTPSNCIVIPVEGGFQLVACPSETPLPTNCSGLPLYGNEAVECREIVTRDPGP